MAVCFKGSGIITLKKETATEFVSKFKELIEKYDKDGKVIFDNKRIIEFENYARHFFFGECKKLIEENISLVDEGRLWFDCHDEDGSVNKPFPFMLMFEIVDGKLYEEVMNTRLPCEWDFYNSIPIKRDNDKESCDNEKQTISVNKSRTENRDDLPF